MRAGVEGLDAHLARVVRGAFLLAIWPWWPPERDRRECRLTVAERLDEIDARSAGHSVCAAGPDERCA